MFNVTINDISVIYVTAHRCAGGLKKKLHDFRVSHTDDFRTIIDITYTTCVENQ